MRRSRFQETALALALLVVPCAPALFAQAAPIEPAKSFEDIPALAKSSTEVKQRTGKITDTEGRTVLGDKLTEPVTGRLRQWTKDLTEQAMAQAMHPQATGAGTITPDTARMVQLMQTTAMNLHAEIEKEVVAYGETRGRLDEQYQKDLDEIEKHTPPTATCKSGYQTQFLKAGDTYLKNLAPAYYDLKAKMKHVATDAQSVLDQANKTLGANPPFFARHFIQQLTGFAMGALDKANSEESEAVVEVYRKSVGPWLGCNHQPHL
jgi:hypothetical protein